MDEDSSIRVLHFHNPHLLWIELKKHDSFALRQVGLFGVVPRQASTVDGERLCTKSDSWDPRANDIVEEFLETKHLLTFKSTYRLEDDDDPTSIFNNQPHIFGEITMIKPDGVKKQLANCLDNSVYAYKSKNEFWQMLTTGKINTVLNEDEALDVLQNIKQYYQRKGTWYKKKDIFYQHVSPSQLLILQNDEPKLTAENLEKHHIMTERKSLLEKPKEVKNYKKYQDFNLGGQELASVEFMEDMIKRHTVIVESDNESGNGNVKNYGLDTKEKVTSGVLHQASKFTTYDEEIDEEVKNNESDTPIGRANSCHKPETKGTDNTRKKIEKLVKLKERCRPKEHSSESDKSLNDQSKNIDIQDVSREPMSHKESRNTSYECSEECGNSKSASSRQDYEELTVMSGPPMNDLTKLVRVKIMKKVNKSSNAVDDNAWTGNINWEKVCKDADSGNKSDVKHVQNESKNVHNRDNSRNVQSSDFGDIYKSDVPKNVRNRDFRNVHENDETNNVYKSYYKKVQRSDVSRNVEIRDSNNVHNTNLYDLNDPKGYNDFVQSKQNVVENKQYNTKNKSSNDESNVNENKDQHPTKQKISKLLEMMSKRKPRFNDNSSNPASTTNTDTKSSKDSDLDELDEIHAKLDSENKPLNTATKTTKIEAAKEKNHVNPYKNLDGSKSIFVEELVQPLILAHSKNNNKILPQNSLRDIPFKIIVQNTLRNKNVQVPTRLQSVTWPYVLRGHSVFMISPAGSGKTLGYLPAVCNLILDYNFDFPGLGPKCIIVCATALSVSAVAKDCKLFLNHQKVLTSFPGIDNKKLVTELVNGCDIFVSTPSTLCKLLRAVIGVDMRRLTTMVFEDCERLENVYELELKALQLYVKQMLKSRTDKQVKVQYILASRKWCDFMNPLAKKAPDTIVTFAAFHECVLYSKTNTQVSFVKKDKKVEAVVEFLKGVDDTKLTVIVCRSDDEVDLLEAKLTSLNYKVVACNNKMTIQSLYKIRTEDYGSLLICCDGNLPYVNVTYANYLVQFSMPAVYTQFCARFAVLNDNYPSIFGHANADVKIKILLEETNVEELPKILNFVKRCSGQVPAALDEVAIKVLERKDLAKAEKLVPICDSLLSLGECVDMYTCQERHAILKGYDDPKEWLPRNGIITFKIIHYNSAISYSARLLTHTIGENRKKYPETYGTLCMKLGMYFSKEQNKRLHGEPKLGDICAVAMRKSFIARCQVLKILNYEKKHAKNVVINLIDEEQIQITRAVELYYLPEEFKTAETHVVKVRLASIRPQDKDVTFSELALDCLKRITDDDEQLYLKGRVAMSIGKTIFVETLEACADLSALCETVVKYDFKNLLLETHAIPNPDHVPQIQKLCDAGNLKVIVEPEVVKAKARTIKKQIEHRWAHLDRDDWTEVIYSSTVNAGKFFIRPQKFDKCVNLLISDIKNHVSYNPEQVENVCVKDVVLAEFPDDSVYERAIIEEIIDDTKVKCFFVDNADWRDVAVSKLKPIPQNFIKQIPFQSIECRLIGIKPHNEEWTEFSTNWLHDNCLEDDKGNSKVMYVKYYTKEKAEVTGGHSYGVVLVDTSTEEDVVINKRMIELNLAAVHEEEIEYLDKPLDFVREKTDTSSFDEDLEELEELQKNDANERRNNKEMIPIPITLMPKDDEIEWDDEVSDIKSDKIAPFVPKKTIEEIPKIQLKNIFPEKPIRSFPLVADSDEDFDKWDVCIDEDLGKCFGLPKLSKSYNDNTKNVEVKMNKPEMQDVNKRENATSTPIKPKLSVLAYGKNDSDDKEKPTQQTKSNKKQDVITKPYVTDLLVENSKNLEQNNNKTENINIVKKVTEVVNTSEVNDPNNVDILKGEIKDVSLYDSDDTLSIKSDKEGALTKKISLNKDESSVLDSDDTQSVITEIGKDRTEELNVSKDSEEVEDNSKNVDQHEPIPKGKTITITETTEPTRTPQLVWRQDKNKITIKIKLVVDDYTLETGNRSLKFSAYQNEIKYAFNLELYGVIEPEKTTHSNKGQYILVNIFTLLKKATRWLKLTKDSIKNWIVYDMDSIDTSSDEEESCNNDVLKAIMDRHERALEIDDEDDDIDDTSGYRYRDD